MAAPDRAAPRSLRPAGLDRCAEERATPGLLDALRAAGDARVLVVWGDRAPVDARPGLKWVTTAQAPGDAEWAFLGRDDEGSPQLLAVVPSTHERPFGADDEWAALRTVGGELASADGDALVSGVALGRWLLDSAFCAACGARCVVRDAGWSMRCPECARQHFPRTDPAVIVAVTSRRDPDRVLLGSNALWGAERYSCFAGFVEAGESLEAAVAREVAEEAGVRVTDVRYRGSQSWPYPRSLMVGFLATAVDDDEAVADGEEIAAVRWFHRDEIGAALAGSGDIRLPGRASIAHRLISEWQAGHS